MDSNLYSKNQVITVDIVDISTRGEGIGKVNGYTVFVQGGIPGDRILCKLIKIKNNYAIGIIEEFIHYSKDRVESKCKYFNECGGCQLLNVDYEKQLKIKRKIVVDALERIGKFVSIEDKVNPTLGMAKPYKYRNKVQYKLTPEGLLGFYEKASHKVVAVDTCLIQNLQSTNTMRCVEEFLYEFKIPVYDEHTHKGVIRGIVERVSSYNGELMLIFILNVKNFKYRDELVHFMNLRLPQVVSIYFNINRSKTNLVLSDENKLIYGKAKIIDSIGDLKYEISPSSFFQVNPQQNQVLYDKVVEFAELKGDEIVFDLYCGIGSISLYLAKHVKKVYGIEVVPEAIKDAKVNMKVNDINNTEFIQGKAEEKTLELITGGVHADLVVLDPPRKGCEDKLLHAILEMKANKIVYVSCNPSTLARDLKILCEGEYNVEKVQPVDLFPQTAHVETVALLQREIS